MKTILACAMAVAAAVALPTVVQAATLTPKPAPLPITGIRSIGITVSDIDAALAFYARAVPYKVVRRYRFDAARLAPELVGKSHRGIEIALVRMPNMFIQLMDFAPGEPAVPEVRPVIGPGYTHICFQSPATDSAYPRFREAGLAMVSRGDTPVDIGGYGVLYAYGRDADGTMIENEVLTTPKFTDRIRVSHIANVTPDRDAMLAFYEKLLGYPVRLKTDAVKSRKYDDIGDIDGIVLKGAWFSVGNMELEFWQYLNPVTPRPVADRKLDALGYNALNFEVADVGKERRRLQRLGVRLAGRVVTIGGWKTQFAYDPDGNLFSVQQDGGGNARESIGAHTGAFPPKRS